jgi:hypothetical protein
MQNSLWNKRNGGRYTQEFKDSHLCVHKSCGTWITHSQTLWGWWWTVSCIVMQFMISIFTLVVLQLLTSLEPMISIFNTCGLAIAHQFWTHDLHFHTCCLAISHWFWTHNCSKDRPSTYLYPSSFCWDAMVVWFSFSKFQHQQIETLCQNQVKPWQVLI